MTLDEALRRIQPVDREIATAVQARLDRLTKPLGSLGRLEETAVRYATITGEVKPNVPRGVVFTFAADHGVATEGVSAYPREVTPQMVLNFLRGGAGVNVLARHVGVEVRVVDIGVAYEFGPLPGLIRKKVMMGTRNLLAEPAMNREKATEALQVGIDLAGPERQVLTQLVMVLFRNCAATIEELKTALLVSSSEREEAERYSLLVLAFRNPSPREPRGIDPIPPLFRVTCSEKARRPLDPMTAGFFARTH